MISKIVHMNLTEIGLKVSLMLLAYFSPVKEIIHAVLALFMIDFLTGLWKSRVVKRRITSHRLRKSVYKMVSYVVAIISAHVLNQSLLDGSLHLPQIIAGYIGVTELISILENLSEITGKDLMHQLALKVSELFKNKYLK